ncbi:MAG: hypothetical protein DCF32_14020 [Leptolyngbya sp.]|nr:MAG: hypothetical protein DCF32_14020 [Leptolyngbya sp.]
MPIALGLDLRPGHQLLNELDCVARLEIALSSPATDGMLNAIGRSRGSVGISDQQVSQGIPAGDWLLGQ